MTRLTPKQLMDRGVGPANALGQFRRSRVNVTGSMDGLVLFFITDENAFRDFITFTSDSVEAGTLYAVSQEAVAMLASAFAAAPSRSAFRS